MHERDRHTNTHTEDTQTPHDGLAALMHRIARQKLTFDSPSRTEISTASNVAQHNHYNWYHVEIYHIELSS